MFPRTRMLYSGWLKLLRTSPVLIYWSSVKCLSGQSPKDAKNTTPTPDADWQKIQKCLLRHRQTRGQLLSSGQETPVSLCILSCTWLICEPWKTFTWNVSNNSHIAQNRSRSTSSSCFTFLLQGAKSPGCIFTVALVTDAMTVFKLPLDLNRLLVDRQYFVKHKVKTLCISLFSFTYQLSPF